uniref:Kv channel-interacting protein 1 n=1 Tax=Cacopsylla melanoneura TaxID=428564 RepID=A0A8D8Y310_9HEMI
MSESASGSKENKNYRKVSVDPVGVSQSRCGSLAAAESVVQSRCGSLVDADSACVEGDKEDDQSAAVSTFITKFFRAVWKKMSGSVSNSSEQEEYPEFIDHSELTEDNLDSPRYRPQSIESLCRATKFSEAEIKKIYRNFKSECPTGTIRQETFKGIYAKFFPYGVASYRYAHYVFNTLDHNKLGYLNFEDFVKGLSVLCRGSMDEKLRWIFTLYDINGDGVLSRDDLFNIVSSVYELMGVYTTQAFDNGTVAKRVEIMFQRMDRNKNGQITLDEFLDLCSNDKDIQNSIRGLTMPSLNI